MEGLRSQQMMLRARLLRILRLLLQLVRRLALRLLLQLLLRGTAVAIRVEASSSAAVVRSAEFHVHSVTRHRPRRLHLLLLLPLLLLHVLLHERMRLEW